MNQPKEYFDSTSYWDTKPSQFQEVILQACAKPGVSVVNVLCAPQTGKSFLAYDEFIMKDITLNWNKPETPETPRRRDEDYAIVIPQDKEINRFLEMQMTKPFGQDEDGFSCKSIENVRIPIWENGGIVWQPLVKKKYKSEVTTIEFFNGCKLYFFAADANPEKHINGFTLWRILFDEYAKFKQNITKITQARLTQKNGQLLTVTTLNENDPNNWYCYEVLKDYKEKGELMIEPKPGAFCGLEIYRKQAVGYVEVPDEFGKSEKVALDGKSYLFVGDFEKIWRYAHNGRGLFLRVQNDLQLGSINAIDYKNLYRCSPSFSNLQILSNYSPDVNHLDITGIDVKAKFPIQIIGYDHGSGKQEKGYSGVGWAKIAKIQHPNPKYEQYVILDSGVFFNEDAETGVLANFFDAFGLLIFYDPSLFWSQASDKLRKIDWFYGRHKVHKKMFPAGGELKMYNSSGQRIAFWQKGLLESKPLAIAKQIALAKEQPFNEAEYIEYKNPLRPEELGCQIYIAVDQNNPDLNKSLIYEIENYKKTDHGLYAKEKRHSVTDIFDASSYGILGFQSWKSKVERFFSPESQQQRQPQRQAVQQLSPYQAAPRRHLITPQRINNTYRTF